MNHQELLDFIRKNPVGFMASSDRGRPRVRPMTVWLADKTGLYFYTSRLKNLMMQLLIEPAVEIAFHQPGTPPDPGTLVRVAGRAEFVDDMATRKRLWELNPWLEKIGTGTPDNQSIAVFRIPSGEYSLWTWENNIQPGPWLVFPRSAPR